MSQNIARDVKFSKVEKNFHTSWIIEKIKEKFGFEISTCC